MGESGKESNQMQRILTMMLPAAVVVLALAGCGPKEKVADAAEPPGEPPASIAEPYKAEAEPPAAGDAPGKVHLEARCAVCHQKEKADRAGWEKIVDEMIGKGAKLDDAEREAVVGYLTAAYEK